MQAYEINKSEGAKPVYVATLADVRLALRTIGKQQRGDVRVCLVAHSDSKEERLRVLNGQPPQVRQMRAWRLSPRGRLVVIKPEEWDKWM